MTVPNVARGPAALCHGSMEADRGRDRPHDTEAGIDASWSRPGWRGRTREWRPIAELLRAIRRGRGGVVLVEGPMGVGKTRLLHEAAEAAARAKIAGTDAAGDEFGRLVPLALLATALREPALGSPEPTLSWRALTAEPPGAETVDLRPSLVERLRSRFEERAGRGPLLITLDDLQWADPTTRLALRSLLPELASYPLGWILSRTSGMGDQALDGLYSSLARHGAARVVLGPLDDHAVAEIAADVLGAPPGPDVLDVTADAEGNPFLLIELLKTWELEGAVEVARGGARLTPAARVQASARSRLLRQPEPTRQLLQVAAILGHSFSVDDLAEMLGEPVDGLLTRLTQTIRAGIIVPDVDRLAFRHDMLWQIATEMVPKPVRLALQRQAGEMLLRRGAVVPAAGYLVRCARPGDERALDGLERAAHAVLPYSPPSAADLAVRALELTDPSDHPALLARTMTAVDALKAAGRLTEAMDSARETLRQAPSGPWADRLRYELASIFLLSGRPAQAVTEAENLLMRQDLGRELHDLTELARFQGLLALHEFGRGRARAKAILADRPGHADTALVGALLLSAHLAWEEARADDAFRDLHEAVRLADRGSIGARLAYPRLFLVRCLTGMGRHGEADNVLWAATADFETYGSVAHAATPAFFRACLSLAAGRTDDAAAEAETGLKAADEWGTYALTLLGLAALAIVAVRKGDLETAEQHIERLESERRAAQGELYGSLWSTWAVSLVTEARSGPREAMEPLRNCYANVRDRCWMLMLEPNAAAWMTRIALAAGNHSAAADIVETARQIAHDNPGHPALAAAAAHAQGILSGDATALVQAAAQHSDPWGTASATEDLGLLLINDREAAIEKFDEAAEGYRRIGALRDAARIRARLRNLGVRRRHWTYADRPAIGWDSLTDSERSVASLVAQGLTNRQVAAQMFLSPHTVSFHLRQVFRKLDIGSRVELARIVPEQPGPDESAVD
ncbi:helix-turn-helix transcriptional regulator [Spirillospora sp. CA-128828]|uniref:helix-turn-helix transcriptional regulator n=1 Tax=Spirillospora sp. CA-128828 TaxID=3240033 RepID=UPI003D8EA931